MVAAAFWCKQHGATAHRHPLLIFMNEAERSQANPKINNEKSKQMTNKILRVQHCPVSEEVAFGLHSQNIDDVNSVSLFLDAARC